MCNRPNCETLLMVTGGGRSVLLHNEDRRYEQDIAIPIARRSIICSDRPDLVAHPECLKKKKRVSHFPMALLDAGRERANVWMANFHGFRLNHISGFCAEFNWRQDPLRGELACDIIRSIHMHPAYQFWHSLTITQLNIPQHTLPIYLLFNVCSLCIKINV